MDERDRTKEELLEELRNLRLRVAELEGREEAHLGRVRELEALQAEGKQTEEEIIRLERLHALEEMARGVAHNFNNVLVGVLGYAQIIEMQSSDPKAVHNARKIVENALRAKELVQRLSFSVRRAGELPHYRVPSLNTIVREVIKATRPKWKEEAEAQGVSFALAADLGEVPSVDGNPVDLHQILVHLLFNAVEAMPEGGEIDISTRSVGEMVEVEVKDRGVGMDGGTRKRIFEPFFTTKRDVGSGLGLSMVYRTVTGWGGRIEVESAPGEGSTFRVLLPAWKGETEGEEGAEAVSEEGPGRILVVEDEEMVRGVLVEALEAYRVEVVSSGEEALDRFQAGLYGVALIDLKLPGIPGDEVARRLKEIDSRLVTVLVTGWELDKEESGRPAFDFHLKKPFKLDEMRELVDRAMARWGGSET